jgi:cation diffusion facilitator family transporter
MIIGLAMMAMAVYTIITSAYSLFEGAALTFSYQLVSAAVLALCVKACLYGYTTKINRQYNSILIRANAQDHRNDICVATGTLAAVLFSLTGAYWMDGAAGIGISCWIIYTGFGIMKDASKVLMDSNASGDMLRKYEDEINMIDGVDHIDSVVAMPVGATYILIAKVSVDRNLSVMEGHAISKRIEQLLLEKQQEIEDVIVHINPDLPHREA